MDVEDPIFNESLEYLKDEFDLSDDADWFKSDFNCLNNENEQLHTTYHGNDDLECMVVGLNHSDTPNNNAKKLSSEVNLVNNYSNGVSSQTCTPENEVNVLKSQKAKKSSDKKNKIVADNKTAIKNKNSNKKSLTSKIAELHPESVSVSASIVKKAMEEGLDSLNLDPQSAEGKVKLRQIRNRVSAQLHRDNKKLYISDLEREVSEYKEQVSGLKALVKLYIAENTALRDQIGRIRSADMAMAMASGQGQAFQQDQERYRLPECIDIPSGTLDHSVVAAVHPDVQLALMKQQALKDDQRVLERDNSESMEASCSDSSSDAGVASPISASVELEVPTKERNVVTMTSTLDNNSTMVTAVPLDVMKSLRNYYSSLHANASLTTGAVGSVGVGGAGKEVPGNMNVYPQKKRRLEHANNYSEDDAHTSGFESDHSDVTTRTASTSDVTDGPDDEGSGHSSDDGSGSEAYCKGKMGNGISRNATTRYISSQQQPYVYGLSVNGSTNKANGAMNPRGHGTGGVVMFSFLFLFSFAFWKDLKVDLAGLSSWAGDPLTTSNTYMDWQYPLNGLASLWGTEDLSNFAFQTMGSNDNDRFGSPDNGNSVYKNELMVELDSTMPASSQPVPSAMTPSIPSPINNFNSLVSKIALSPSQLQLSLASDSQTKPKIPLTHAQAPNAAHVSVHPRTANSVSSTGSVGRVLLQSQHKGEGNTDDMELLELTPAKFAELYNTYVTLLNTIIEQQMHHQHPPRVRVHPHGAGERTSAERGSLENDLSKQLWVYPPTMQYYPLYSHSGGTEEDIQKTDLIPMINVYSNVTSLGPNISGSPKKHNYLRKRIDSEATPSTANVEKDVLMGSGVGVYEHQMEQLKTLHVLLKRYQQAHLDKAAASSGVSTPSSIVAVPVTQQASVPALVNSKEVGENFKYRAKYLTSGASRKQTGVVAENLEASKVLNTYAQSDGASTAKEHGTGYSYDSRVLVTNGKALLHPHLGPDPADSNPNSTSNATADGMIVNRHTLKLLLPASSVVWGGTWPTRDKPIREKTEVTDSSTSIVPTFSNPDLTTLPGRDRFTTRNGRNVTSGDTDSNLFEGSMENMWVEVQCNVLNTKLINEITTIME